MASNAEFNEFKQKIMGEISPPSTEDLHTSETTEIKHSITVYNIECSRLLCLQ